MKQAIDKHSFTIIKNNCYHLTWFFIIILICISNTTPGDEICDPAFNVCPKDFNGDTRVVYDQRVTFSNGVYALEVEKVIEEITDRSGPSSIVFVIDHSYSMMGLGNTS